MAKAIVSDTTVTFADGTTVETIVYDDGSRSVTSTPGPGTLAANQATLQARATTALTSNANDLTQDASIITQAATVPASGTFTLAQCTTFIRQLAQAVSTLAQNDENSKHELNVLIQLWINKLDTIV